MKKIIFTCCLLISIMFGNVKNFILCEGNFGSPNASVWSFNINNGSFGAIEGPVYWDENSNPLGDTGHSMTVINNRLFVVMNNSHSVEILDLDGEDISFVGTISLPFASPRYLITYGESGYISCWNLSGLVEFDLQSFTITDTIFVGGMPEMMAIHEDILYTSIIQNSDWSSGDRVLSIDLSTETILDTFTVVPGPNNLLIHNENLYVSSTYYDLSYNTFVGNSKINIVSGEVMMNNLGLNSNFGYDLVIIQDQVYRVYNGGIAPLNPDLSIDSQNQIGNYGSIYSANVYGKYIYFGVSNYVAPDTVFVLNLDGTSEAEYIVGAFPGSFAFHDFDETVSVNHSDLPKEISLLLNYPNPFNPMTHLEFVIDKNADISLNIFDIKGNLVEVLVNDYLQKGRYTFRWNTNIFSSGVYFAVLEYDKKFVTKKLSLIK